MQEIYSFSKVLSFEDVDCYGRWRADRIFLLMQNAATAHSNLLGVGRKPLLEKNVIWVLSRAELHMDRYPQFGEEIKVNTWPGKMRHFFAPRYFILYAGGEKIGCAVELWLIVDLEKRRMVDPKAKGIEMPDIDLESPLPMPAGAEAPQTPDRTVTRRATFSDLDENMHVNNTSYITWLLENLDTYSMESREISLLKVDYTKEIKPETQVTLAFSDNADGFAMLGSGAEGEKHFVISGKMRGR
ncbi:MAG: thioesterase [Eubacteriales bacterium]|nr:thioesterase [Eubacteriales bacterium]MDD3880896.1 thioesterase [Eubacteriales bacterium]MDD4511737.1 thioesterase [Eubacteriales bacterium]